MNWKLKWDLLTPPILLSLASTFSKYFVNRWKCIWPSPVGLFLRYFFLHRIIISVTVSLGWYKVHQGLMRKLLLLLVLVVVGTMYCTNLMNDHSRNPLWFLQLPTVADAEIRRTLRGAAPDGTVDYSGHDCTHSGPLQQPNLWWPTRILLPCLLNVLHGGSHAQNFWSWVSYFIRLNIVLSCIVKFFFSVNAGHLAN